MIKLTPVTKDGNITNSELVNGDFDQICRGLSRELSQLKNYSFIVVTKHNNDYKKAS